MALTGAGPDSGTSGWFFNVGDNSSLDANQHTVFGRAIAGGINVVETINQVSTADLRDIVGQPGLLNETPLIRNPADQLTGTVNLTQDSNVLTGNGTQFTTELRVGDAIGVSLNEPVIVTSIISDTELTVDLEVNASETGVAMARLTPQDEDYIIFSDIGTLLDQI